MLNIIMQKTIENLTKAFIGESQARNRYTMYAKVAQKEGFEQIGAIFLETADQEAQHAKWLFKLINELKKDSSDDFSEVKVEVGAPTTIGTTMENLDAAISGENYEHTEMYPEFSKIADEEKLPEIAARLRSISRAEAHHEERYKKLANNLDSETVFRKAKKVEWTCRKCGYVHAGEEAPDRCPGCDHPKSYYQVKCEEY